MERVSALAWWGNHNAETAVGKGHSDIVKPADTQDVSVIILKNIFNRDDDRTNLPNATSETLSVAISIVSRWIPLKVTFADGTFGRITYKAVIRAIADKAPLLIMSFGTYNEAYKQIREFVEN